MNRINTYVFLDLETTGFPCQEGNRTQITEFAMIAVKTDHILTGEVPRVLQKFTQCFRPSLPISQRVFDITGLNNDLLKNENVFTSSASVNAIRSFFDLQTPPVCIVSHNGCGFDFPILRAEIERAQYRLSDEILCTDSLKMFRTILKNKSISPLKSTPEREQNQIETDDFELPYEVIRIAEECDKNLMSSPTNVTPTKKRARVSYKLKDIYERLTGKSPVDAHHAEYDSMMLLECCVKTAEEFIEWTQNHSVPFNNVPKMEAGKSFSSCFISL